MLEDWDPRRPASWIGVLLRGGRDTTWSLVLIPIDLVTVDIGRSNSCSVLLDSPGQTQVAWLTRGAASFERAPSGPCRSRWGGACDRRRSRLVEPALRAAAPHVAPTQWLFSFGTIAGVLHVGRRIAGILAALVTLAVIRRGRGCFAATAVAIARCHTITLSAFGAVLVMLEDRDPRRPASWIDSPRRTRNALFAGAHLH